MCSTCKWSYRRRARPGTGHSRTVCALPDVLYARRVRQLHRAERPRPQALRRPVLLARILCCRCCTVQGRWHLGRSSLALDAADARPALSHSPRGVGQVDGRSDPRRRRSRCSSSSSETGWGKDYLLPAGPECFPVPGLHGPAEAQVFRRAGPDSAPRQLRRSCSAGSGERRRRRLPLFPAGVCVASLAALPLIFAASVVSHQLDAVSCCSGDRAGDARVDPAAQPSHLDGVLSGPFSSGAPAIPAGHLRDLVGGVGQIEPRRCSRTSQRGRVRRTIRRARRVVHARLPRSTAFAWSPRCRLRRCRKRSMVPIAALAVYAVHRPRPGERRRRGHPSRPSPPPLPFRRHARRARDRRTRARRHPNRPPACAPRPGRLEGFGRAALGLVGSVLAAAAPSGRVHARRHGMNLFKKAAQRRRNRPSSSTRSLPRDRDLQLNTPRPENMKSRLLRLRGNLTVAPWAVKDPATIFAPW